jgi:hypothetical protein
MRSRLPNIVRQIKSRRLILAGYVGRMDKDRSALNILTGKYTGKSPLRRPKRRWKESIRMDLKEIGIDTRSWVNSAQDRDYWRALANATLNFRVPYAVELI